MKTLFLILLMIGLAGCNRDREKVEPVLAALNRVDADFRNQADNAKIKNDLIALDTAKATWEQSEHPESKQSGLNLLMAICDFHSAVDAPDTEDANLSLKEARKELAAGLELLDKGQ